MSVAKVENSVGYRTAIQQSLADPDLYGRGENSELGVTAVSWYIIFWLADMCKAIQYTDLPDTAIIKKKQNFLYYKVKRLTAACEFFSIMRHLTLWVED